MPVVAFVPAFVYRMFNRGDRTHTDAVVILRHMLIYMCGYHIYEAYLLSVTVNMGGGVHQEPLK